MRSVRNSAASRSGLRAVGFAMLAACAAARGSVAAEVVVSDARALAAAVRGAAPGDVVLMAEGVWKDADLVCEGRGTAERPVIVRARTPGEVIVSGHAQLRIAGTGLVVDGLWFKDGAPAGGHGIAFRTAPGRLARDCRLTNCAMTDFNPERKQTDTKWVSLYGTNNRVDHCALAGKSNEGTTLVVWVGEGPGGHRIDHNWFGPRPRLGVNGGETIRVGTSDRATVSARTVVESNVFESCNGEGEIISNKSCDNVYRHNLFVECEGALTLRHGDRATVDGNVFLGGRKKNTGGVRVIGAGHRVINNYFEGLAGTGPRAALCLMNGIPDSPAAGYFPVSRSLVAFNTFVDCRTTFLVGFAGGAPDKVSLPPRDSLIANNIVINATAPVAAIETEPVAIAWRGNVAFGGAGGVPAGPGFRSIDPRLLRGEGGLLRPAADSPALGAAIGVAGFPEVSTDIDGQSRGTQKDVGCDQR